MKPEAQRIAIAEACGAKWKRLYQGVPPPAARKRSLVLPLLWPKSFANLEDAFLEDVIEQCHDLPDYLNDLNAMHEAEKVIHAAGKWDVYRNELAEELGVCWGHATAKQRAEAFLRTLNLWNSFHS